MMPIRFLEEAEADLQGIIGWYEDVAPEALGNILSDIFRTIDRLSRYPRSGMRVPGRKYRRVTTIKYHFKVVYEIGPSLILVLGLYRYPDREL